MIGRMGTELAYAMCMGCPAPKEKIAEICHALKGAEAYEKGNLCYLDEYKKGKITLICAGCGDEFDNPHDLYCSDCRYSPDHKYFVCDFCGYSVVPGCSCSELELEEMIALDWLKSDDCDNSCNTCWFSNSCYGSTAV